MAVIRVTGGPLTSANVTSEMERLFPGGWRLGAELWRRPAQILPRSRAEMQHMVEWGVLHTKFPGTTLRF